MKPEILAMQAFGPYGGRQLLDFAALGRYGFFLIHGPTGAGKTTILDAMAFALYGDTSGADRDARDMRSDHADPALRTEVRLDFAVGDKRYRVQRSPWQQRPKRRGDGFTVENATAALWDRSDTPPDEPHAEGRPLASKPTEVTARVEQILGFRSVQFRQVVMLPQGKFQELLQASGKDREEILQRLFRTERYRDLQEALKAEAQAIEREVQQATAERAAVLRTTDAEAPDEVGERLARLVEQVCEAEAQAAAAAAAEQVALAQLSQAQGVAARLDELVEAQADVAALAAGVEQAQALRAELGLARKAEPLLALDRLVHDRRNDLTPRLLELEMAEIAHDAADELATLEAAWSLGQAANLSAALAPGVPCPVCGSTEHPAPAVAQGTLPGEVAVLDKRAQLTGLRRDYDQARDAADAAAGAARRELAAAGTAQASAAAVLDERLRGVPAELRDPGELAHRLDQARGELDALEQAFVKAQADDRATSESLARATTAHAELQRRHDELAAAVAKVEAERLERIAQAGFADERAYFAARREPQKLAELVELVAAHDAETTAAAARLRRAAAAATDLERPDLDLLARRHAVAARAADEARDTRAARAAARDALARAADDLARLQATIGEHEATYAIVGRLARVADGDNDLRLSFQRYMLAAYLDDVLVVASQRLSAMTDQRFTLLRRQQGDKRRALGLDLEVADAYTGARRPVSTLSGGETFQASLALALGLAEVVQSYEGGLKLDTVFVDEGFGSLDPDNLAAALDTLIGLQTGGRLVGIISHVADLREQIEARLEVTTTRSGSQARFVVP
jgi:exonuclease SbcC